MAMKRVLIVGSDPSKYSRYTKALIEVYKKGGHEVRICDNELQGQKVEWTQFNELAAFDDITDIEPLVKYIEEKKRSFYSRLKQMFGKKANNV